MCNSNMLLELTCNVLSVKRELNHCSGRFMMFSVITNIYNKKTKGPTLMGLFKSTSFFKYN